ncbi:hypothetical protein JAAARDRAFT_172736 [Jaapia argillacea MUCL 33604]|uniref:N-acetyltransferase ECO1 n=1 Tax=Jaapia argillacea MUCL 33604 TaxID=933084 RepID=A0A067Q120_9AGAM|nr:hypothetical protein JAAARDRAFT_172736 [Jaapia argillacea MUCL 33604]
MSSRVKRTYSRLPKPPLPSSPPSGLSSPPHPSVTKRKRPLIDRLSLENAGAPPTKKRALAVADTKANTPQNKKTLTQLHFAIETSVLKTCSICSLSYTKGAPDDESLHRAHCSRVQRGMEWGKEEEREKVKANVEEVVSGVRLKNGQKGRIISYRADVRGKIGSKTSTLLETINLALSSPPLPHSVLQVSKIYLFLLSSTSTSAASREKIVGCVVAQRISTAMAISTSPPDSSPSQKPGVELVAVDTATGLYCHPTPLPTPLGIPRIFVSSTHRRQSIASTLLSAAASTFIHGCPLDPVKGEVAFSQPTSAGREVMSSWGKGGVRIYEE